MRNQHKYTVDEIKEHRIKNGLFYHNEDDLNILIPKAIGFGYTFNWGNPLSIKLLSLFISLLIMCILLLIVILLF